MIELALAFSVILPLFYGTIQSGLGFLYYNELANAVRAGARYASCRTFDSASQTPSAAFTTAVKNVTVYGDPAGGKSPVVRGLSPEHVTVTVDFARNVPNAITVSISNFPMNALFRTFTLNKPAATFAYAGVYMP